MLQNAFMYMIDPEGFLYSEPKDTGNVEKKYLWTV